MITVSDDDDLNLINSVHLACRLSLNSLMRLGTGALKGWWGPCKNTRHSREVPWEPCEWERALQAATITLKELQWKNVPDLIRTMKHFL